MRGLEITSGITLIKRENPSIMTTKQLQGFKTVTIRFSVDSTSEHTMFMKEHLVRNQSEDKPIGRTLYIINVPPWATTSLEKSFASHGMIESVTITKLKDTTNSGFKAAYVVFKKEQDLYKALNVTSLPPVSTPTDTILTGLNKLVKEYNDGLLSQFNREQEMLQLIKAYDAKETERKRKDKALETDDEGWMLVTKKGRNPGLERKESVNVKLMAKSRKEKVLKNFYRHQIRQTKRDQLATLRKKAEEDKKKILALKQRRAFKPF